MDQRTLCQNFIKYVIRALCICDDMASFAEHDDGQLLATIITLATMITYQIISLSYIRIKSVDKSQRLHITSGKTSSLANAKQPRCTVG